MAEYFDGAKFREAAKHPDWYVRIQGDYEEFQKQVEKTDEETKDKMKRELYGLVEDLLEKKELYLGESGHNFDEDRKKIEMVIIHHTSGKPGMPLNRLSAIHLIRLYAPYYANPTSEAELHIKGKPIYSGHFYKGNQVFWGYHWFVRGDGSFERILKDEEVGWQAGNWDINCRSVAICLDGDFENATPNDEMIAAVAKIINKQYQGIEKAKILGHREVNPKTDCPGSKFLDSWKLRIVKSLSKV